MSRLFIDTKELDFFTSVNKELIQKIVGQKIIYYSISDEHTRTNDLYDEAVIKTVFTPVEVNALILYTDTVETTTKFSIDMIYQIEVYFYDNELKERNIIPREGDFVKFGEVFYEILQLTRPQITFGQIENQVMVKSICRVSRESNFVIKEQT